jgi:hypothetical protein
MTLGRAPAQLPSESLDRRALGLRTNNQCCVKKRNLALKCQTGITNAHDGRRAPPYAFTEQGAAMLSSVLSSQLDVQDQRPSGFL